jgi:hypothetical protein
LLTLLHDEHNYTEDENSFIKSFLHAIRQEYLLARDWLDTRLPQSLQVLIVPSLLQTFRTLPRAEQLERFIEAHNLWPIPPLGLRGSQATLFHSKRPSLLALLLNTDGPSVFSNNLTELGFFADYVAQISAYLTSLRKA